MAILQWFLYIFDDICSQKVAAKQTGAELKLVWKHHLGLKMVYGVESAEYNKLIVMDDKMFALYKEYHTLELESCRKDKDKWKAYDRNQNIFLEDRPDTMNIAKKNPIQDEVW